MNKEVKISESRFIQMLVAAMSVGVSFGFVVGLLLGALR